LLVRALSWILINLNTVNSILDYLPASKLVLSAQERVRLFWDSKKIHYKQRNIVYVPRYAFINFISATGHVAHIGEMRNTYMAFVGKPEGKRLLERPNNRCEANIKISLEEIVLGGGGRGLELI
jgi:hypothetical protein